MRSMRKTISCSFGSPGQLQGNLLLLKILISFDTQINLSFNGDPVQTSIKLFPFLEVRELVRFGFNMSIILLNTDFGSIRVSCFLIK